MAKKKKRSREKRKPEKLNITSLMDALTIILIFLLVNYSDVTEDKELPNFIKLPGVEAKTSSSKFGIVVVIGQDKIKVGKNKTINFRNFESEKDQILGKLKSELSVIQKDLKSRAIAAVDGKEKPIKISIQADEAIEYKTIDQVVEAATELSLNYIDFVSLRKENS